MPRRDLHRVEAELKASEDELSKRLCRQLREVAQGRNTLFFHTHEYNPHGFPQHMLSQESEELLELARKSIESRKLLVLPIDGCIGQLFVQACAETGDLDNPHRLGPIRQAARLLSQIEEAQRERR